VLIVDVNKENSGNFKKDKSFHLKRESVFLVHYKIIASEKL
jgi:hypothetical protein